MRHISITHLISVLAASATATLAIGCGSKATTASAWSCDNLLVPNGSTVECTAESASGLTADTTTYECPINGDINPLCPPTLPDGGTYTGGDTDAGTTTTPPVGTEPDLVISAR